MGTNKLKGSSLAGTSATRERVDKEMNNDI